MAQYRQYRKTRPRRTGFTWRPVPAYWETRVATGTYYEISEQPLKGRYDEAPTFKIVFSSESEEYMAPKDVDAGYDGTRFQVDSDIRTLAEAKRRAENHWDAWRAHPGWVHATYRRHKRKNSWRR